MKPRVFRHLSVYGTLAAFVASAAAQDPPLRLPQRPVSCLVRAADPAVVELVAADFDFLERNIAAFDRIRLRLAVSPGWRSDLEERMRADAQRFDPKKDQMATWQSQLNQLRLAHADATQKATARAGLDRLATELCDSINRLQDIYFYGQQRETISQMRRELESLPLKDPALSLDVPNERELTTDMEQKAAAGEFAEAIATSYRLLYAQHQLEKSLTQRRGWEFAASVGLPMSPRPFACAPATAEPPPPPAPSELDRRVIFYPAQAGPIDPVGRAIVRIRVDTKGCATHALVVQGSGVPHLDEAALAMGFAGTYRPMQVDGRAVVFELLLATNFKMAP